MEQLNLTLEKKKNASALHSFSFSFGDIIVKAAKITFNILKYVFIGVLAVVLLFNAIGIFKRALLKEQIPLVFGFGNAIIVSGSMEPAIAVGDLIVIRKQKTYETGDVVTFEQTGYITHRIVEKTENGYVTQGDANNARDAEITLSQISGKVVVTVPKIGKAIRFFQGPFGCLILILGLAAMIEAPVLIRKLREKSGKQEPQGGEA